MWCMHVFRHYSSSLLFGAIAIKSEFNKLQQQRRRRRRCLKIDLCSQLKGDFSLCDIIIHLSLSHSSIITIMWNFLFLSWSQFYVRLQLFFFCFKWCSFNTRWLLPPPQTVLYQYTRERERCRNKNKKWNEIFKISFSYLRLFPSISNCIFFFLPRIYMYISSRGEQSVTNDHISEKWDRRRDTQCYDDNKKKLTI